MPIVDQQPAPDVCRGGGQLNPFAFKYPAVLIAWFAALADRMGAVSSGGADAVSSFLRVLKSGERPKDGDALEIAFRARVRDDGRPERSVRLVLTHDGFSISERVDATEVVDAFSWKDVECGIRRTYVESGDRRREEVKERRGTRDLASCLAGLDCGLLAASACGVRKFREFQVIRNVGELQTALSECLKRTPCRLRTRNGVDDIRLVAASGRPQDQGGGEVTVANLLSGVERTYPSLSSFLVAIPPGLFSRGLRLFSSED